MSRLAWFTPLPPARSGIAQYSAELLPGLAPDFDIDVFVDGSPEHFVRPDARVRVRSAHDFVWAHARQPYDLVVYQLGNAPCHDYMWAYLVRHPGMVVLHDGQLHHARARSLIQQKRDDDYRSEFQFDHPEADVALAELGIAGLLGSLTYLFPMRRAVVESARLVAVHNAWLADQIREEHPGVPVTVVDMGVPASTPPSDAGASMRARHRIPADAVLFTAFGEVTPEKRIPQALQAMAWLVRSVPNARFLLAGRSVEHYDVESDIRSLGLSDTVTVAGFVPDEDVAAYLAASDVCLCLRWPSSRETSAAWLRCLAAGKATIITDLVHTVDVPALDPRTWTLLHAPSPSRPGDEPVCVSIDTLDEDRSLRLAMRRLAANASLRDALGRSAAALWQERYTLQGMVAAYRSAIAGACAAPLPNPARWQRLPPHFTADGTAGAVRLLREAGVPDDRIADIWRGRS